MIAPIINAKVHYNREMWLNEFLIDNDSTSVREESAVLGLLPRTVLV